MAEKKSYLKEMFENRKQQLTELHKTDPTSYVKTLLQPKPVKKSTGDPIQDKLNSAQKQQVDSGGKLVNQARSATQERRRQERVVNARSAQEIREVELDSFRQGIKLDTVLKLLKKLNSLVKNMSSSGSNNIIDEVEDFIEDHTGNQKDRPRKNRSPRRQRGPRTNRPIRGGGRWGKLASLVTAGLTAYEFRDQILPVAEASVPQAFPVFPTIDNQEEDQPQVITIPTPVSTQPEQQERKPVTTPTPQQPTKEGASIAVQKKITESSMGQTIGPQIAEGSGSTIEEQRQKSVEGYQQNVAPIMEKAYVGLAAIADDQQGILDKLGDDVDDSIDSLEIGAGLVWDSAKQGASQIMDGLNKAVDELEKGAASAVGQIKKGWQEGGFFGAIKAVGGAVSTMVGAGGKAVTAAETGVVQAGTTVAGGIEAAGAVPQGKAFIGWAKTSIKNEYLKRGFSPEQAEIFATGAAAQMVNETGWKAKKTVGQNNFFNIKENKKAGIVGDVAGTGAIDKAERASGRGSKGGYDVYAGYSTPEKGVAAYVDFLMKNPRYAKAGVFQAQSVEEYAQGLKRAGFATDPAYVQKIASIAKSSSLQSALRESREYQQQHPNEIPGQPTTVAYNGPITPAVSHGLQGFETQNSRQIENVRLAHERVKLDKIHPEMYARFAAMAKQYKELTGKDLTVNSAYRSPEEQANSIRTARKGYAAGQGKSLHQFGYAIDLPQTGPGGGDELASLIDPKTGKNLLEAHGFVRPMMGKTGPHEPWHIEPRELAGHRKEIAQGYVPQLANLEGREQAVAVREQQVATREQEVAKQTTVAMADKNLPTEKKKINVTNPQQTEVAQTSPKTGANIQVAQTGQGFGDMPMKVDDDMGLVFLNMGQAG